MKGREHYIWIRMNQKSSIELSLMEPGEEIYAFADYWPKNPATIEIKEDTEMVDISVTKHVIATDLENKEKCEKYNKPTYGGDIYFLNTIFGVLYFNERSKYLTYCFHK